MRRWSLLTRSRRSQDAAAEAFKAELRTAEVTDFEKILQKYVAEMPGSFGWAMTSPEKKLMMYVKQQLRLGNHPKATALLGVIQQHSAAAEACAQQVLSRVKTKR